MPKATKTIKQNLRILETCGQMAVISWSLKDDRFYWSDQFLSLIGLRDVNLKPSFYSFINYFIPDEQSKIQELFAIVSNDGQMVRVHSSMVHSDGRIIPVLLVLNISEEENEIIGYVQDASFDEENRKSLASTAEKYREVMTGAGDAIVLISSDGLILEGNQRAAQLFGVEEEKLSNLSIDNLHPENESEKMMAHYQSFLWGRTAEVVTTVKSITGKMTSVEMNARSVKISGQQILVVIFRDITENLKAQNDLKRSEQRYRSLINEAHEGILLLDETGKILASNPKFCKTIGLRRSFLYNKDFIELTDFNEYTSPIQLLKQAGMRPSVHVEGHIITTDGEKIPTGFNVNRFQEQGSLQFIVTAYDLRDVQAREAERLKLQQQLFQSQKLEVMGHVAGSLAHDFNNLLSPILLISEMLIEESEGNDFFQENLTRINQAGLRARSLVRRILNYTRPEEAELKLINFLDEFDETVSLLRASVPPTIEIFNQVNGEGFSCYGNSDQITQIIMNIGTNAAQAVGNQKGQIFFKLYKKEIDEDNDLIKYLELPEGDYIVLDVEDTGPGIAQDKLEQIFEPFFTTKAQIDGSGLGLSVVKQIVEHHDGAVQAFNIKSEDKIMGACLRLYLPASDPES